MAEYVELFIDQGSDFSTTININDDNTNLPQNVAGCIITSSLRRSLLSANASANLEIAITDGANGEFMIAMAGATSAALRPGPYLFDVKLRDDHFGTNSRLIEGVIFLIPSVTK
jgi:hypothetical protein